MFLLQNSANIANPCVVIFIFYVHGAKGKGQRAPVKYSAAPNFTGQVWGRGLREFKV